MKNLNDLNELSNENLIKLAPAIAATRPMHGASKWYDFVSTMQAIDLLRGAGWKPIQAGQAGTRTKERAGFQKHMVRFLWPTHGLSDQEALSLVMYNSHDRGCSFRLIAGVFRFVCANGMLVGNELFSFKHQHVGFSSEQFVNSALEISGSGQKIGQRVAGMKTIDMTPDEKGVYAMAAHELLYDDIDQAPISPAQLLGHRRIEDKGSDLWSTFNVIQENIMKGGLKGRTPKGRKTTTYPVGSIDRSISLNTELWKITEDKYNSRTDNS